MLHPTAWLPYNASMDWEILNRFKTMTALLVPVPRSRALVPIHPDSINDFVEERSRDLSARRIRGEGSRLNLSEGSMRVDIRYEMNAALHGS